MNPIQSKSTRSGLALRFHSRNPLRHILTGLAPALAVVALAATSIAHAATFTSVTGGDWSSPATWGQTTALPTALDPVVIKHTITIIAAPGAECASVTLDGAGSSLDVGEGQTLTTDAVTLNSNCGIVMGVGQVVIGPNQNLHVAFIEANWRDILVQIVDNPSGPSAVTINVGGCEANWRGKGNHSYSGGTTTSLRRMWAILASRSSKCGCSSDR